MDNKKLKKAEYRKQCKEIRDKIKELLIEGKEHGEIMDITGCCKSMVDKTAQVTGLTVTRLTAADMSKIAYQILYTDKPLREIARQLKFAPGKVLHIYNHLVEQHFALIPRTVGRPRKSED